MEIQYSRYRIIGVKGDWWAHKWLDENPVPFLEIIYFAQAYSFHFDAALETAW